MNLIAFRSVDGKSLNGRGVNEQEVVLHFIFKFPTFSNPLISVWFSR